MVFFSYTLSTELNFINKKYKQIKHKIYLWLDFTVCTVSQIINYNAY